MLYLLVFFEAHHRRQPESDRQPHDAAESLERLCQVESQRLCQLDDAAEPLERPCQLELEPQFDEAAGAAECHDDSAEPLERLGK